jgi:hypothetical protein
VVGDGSVGSIILLYVYMLSEARQGRAGQGRGGAVRGCVACKYSERSGRVARGVLYFILSRACFKK